MPLLPVKKDSVILAALAYVLGPFVALLIYLLEKEDRWVRFHCLQALGLALAYMAVFFVLWLGAILTFGLGGVCAMPVSAGAILLGFWCAYRAYNGEYFELPYVGVMAATHI